MSAGAPATFTCASARSGAITSVLVLLLVVETAALHLLLWRTVPPLAWGLTALSLYALYWLIADYRALGREALRVDAATIEVTIGRRLRASIPRSAVVSILAPTWRDLGASAPAHLNATKPATPNVLIVFNGPQVVRVLGMMRRPITRLSLHADDPARLLATLGRAVPARPFL